MGDVTIVPDTDRKSYVDITEIDPERGTDAVPTVTYLIAVTLTDSCQSLFWSRRTLQEVQIGFLEECDNFRQLDLAPKIFVLAKIRKYVGLC